MAVSRCFALRSASASSARIAATATTLYAQACGRGIGRRLLAALAQAAAAAGSRQMLAMIGDHAHHASLAAHAPQGFVHAGTISNADIGFGRGIDVAVTRRRLVAA